MSEEELRVLVAKANASFHALSSAQQVIHRYEQRRSFARGMCPWKRDYEDYCKEVDKLLPPVDGLPEAEALAVIAKALA